MTPRNVVAWELQGLEPEVWGHGYKFQDLASQARSPLLLPHPPFIGELVQTLAATLPYVGCAERVLW